MKYIRNLKGLKTIDNRKIKDNVLYRSSELYKPNSKQLKYINSIGLKRIVDLRNQKEIVVEKDIEIKGCEYYNFSLVNSDLNGVTHESRKNQLAMLKTMPTMIETYREFITTEYGLIGIKNALREIVLNHKYPIVIHCVTGKDRAGIITFFVLRLLNVSYEDAMNDYLKQHDMYINKARYLYLIGYLFSGFDKEVAIKAYDYFAVRKEFVDAVLIEIDKKFKSFDNFISDYIGLSEKDIEEFRNNLLD